MAVIRWLLMIPGAVVGALAARFVVVATERIGMLYMGIEPGTFLWNAFSQYVGGLIFGGALVFLSALIAPSHKRIVAIAAAGAVIFLLGMLSLPVIARRGYMDLMEFGITLLAGVVVAVGIFRGEIDVGKEPERNAAAEPQWG